MISRESPIGAEWIVCLGAIRPIVRGRVECAAREGRVDVTACLDCHHLESLSGERRVDSCSTARHDAFGRPSPLETPMAHLPP